MNRKKQINRKVQLALKVGGKTYAGFESVQILQNMFSISGAYALSTENYFHKEKNKKGSNLKLGAEATLEINDTPMVTGYIDEMPIKYGDNYNNVEVKGRDKTGDLVDCTYTETPSSWKNQTVRNIIRNLCSPFGIRVTVDDSATSEVSQQLEVYAANEGIPVAELIMDICRDVGIMPIACGDGKLCLTKAGVKNASDAIVPGDNARSAVAHYSDERRYSKTVVKGQGIGTDNKGIADYTECTGEFEDPTITRYRPRTVFADNITNNDKCRKRAIWEARIAAGLSRAVTYTVHGWLQGNGKPWKPNLLVHVNDELIGIDDTMLIYKTNMFYDEEDGGDLTDISVIHKDALSLSTSELNIKSERFDS